MSGSGKDVLPPAPAPSGPGRGRPKKVRPRENEGGNGTVILAEVKRRRRASTAGGETGELGARTAAVLDENEINVVEPVTRSAVRIEPQSTRKRKENSFEGSESGTAIADGLVTEQGGGPEGQEEEKVAALDVVLEVHGMWPQADGCAAAFPGEAGQETGDHLHSCACCIKPEILKLTLICDSCDKTFHVTCLSLDLQSATGLDDWLCTSCRAAYPESAVAGGVTKAIRQDIERKLFSQERKKMQNELRTEVANDLDNGRCVTDVPSASDQIFLGLNEINKQNVFNGDKLKLSLTQGNVLTQRLLLDLNKVDESATTGSSRRNLAIDLNECRELEFEEDVLPVDARYEVPEVEAGAVNDLIPEPGNREPCISSSVASLEPTVSKEIESASNELKLLRTEESFSVRNVVAGSSAVIHAEASSDMGQSCVDGNKHRILAEVTAANEAKSPGFLEDQEVKNRSRPILCSVDFSVQNEKLGFTVVDSKLPQTSEESSYLKKNRSTDLAAVYIDANEEALAGQSIAGECVSVTQMKPPGNLRGEVPGTGRSVIPPAELSLVEKIKPACIVEVGSDGNCVTIENGCVMTTDFQNAPRADAPVTDVPREVLDVRKFFEGNDEQEGGKGTTEPSDKTAESDRNDGNIFLPKQIFESTVVARSELSGDNAKEITMANSSRTSVPTLTITTTIPTRTADGGGIQAECQQTKKAAEVFTTPVSNADNPSCMSTPLNCPLTAKPIEVASPSGADDQQLKKVGADALQQLRDSVKQKHGLILPDGWEVEVRKRRNDKHLDKYYISPKKLRFRSRIEVMKHLGLWDGSKCSPQEGSKLRSEAQLDFNDSLPVDELGAGGSIQLPLNLGDFTLESLGVIDLRPGYWDEQHIWPVGYRCTWHDRTTSSFCISEVADGGCSGPIFLVTRKYCPAVVDLECSERDPLNVSNENPGRTVKDSQVYREDKMTASTERTPFSSIGSNGQLSTGFDVEEDDSLKALLGNISFPLTANQETEIFSRDNRSDSTLRPQDEIGEFTVVASSTVEAWRCYAEKFTECCGKLSDVVGSVLKACSHKTTASAGLVPMEVRDPENLLGKLGEDRFGLDQVLIKELIESLPNADRCSGYKPLKERSVLGKAADLIEAPVEAPVQPQRIRIREKARKQKKSIEVTVPETVAAAAEPIKVSSKEEVDISVSFPVSRQPPPLGQPLELRLPSQYVGDVLQIWEFLCRFSGLIGFSQPPALEDLEEGLSCGSANVRGDETSAFYPEPDGRFCIPGDAVVPNAATTSATCEIMGSPRSLEKKPLPGRTNLGTSAHVSQRKEPGRMERRTEDDGKQIGSPSNDKISLMDGGTEHEVFSTDVIQPRLAEPKLTDEPGLESAAFLHVPVIKFLMGDLQSKICGIEELPGTADELKHKRGRKRVRDIVANACFGREKLTDSFSINRLTWPEVARRYIISLSRIKEIGETTEFGREECMKILRCIQGDGGVLCGALDGVAGMEIDAQLLAEVEKEISSLMPPSEETAAPSTPPRCSSARYPVEDFHGGDPSGECALWVKLLDPIAKLPTNVGSRIRNRVIDALAANPPPWAVEILEYSISKDVYKGNASGPTKRAVMEVLHKYRGEDPAPKVKKTKKQRKRVLPSPEIVMQRCRIVLRQVATADTLRVVSRSYKCMTNFYESEGEGLLARPLDFRAIDLRLGAGAYGTSPDAFAADMKQIWKNLAAIYEKDSAEASAAVELTNLFDSLYKKQVTLFQRGGEQAAKTGSERPDGKSEGQSKDGSQKNAIEERPPGSDAEKPVKAPWEDDSCQVCGIDDDHDNVLLCDGCDAEYHIYCLNPPLPEVPDGNWFCHSCVAVDTGFLEAPSAPETSSETKAPDKQQEDHQIGGHYLEQVEERDQLPTFGGSTFSSLSAVALQLAATDYWHLALSERVDLLKCLCDQALETRKLRSHLEKSMDGAVDLQHELRTLLRAERRKNADSDEATKLDSGKDGSREGSIQSVLQSRSAAFKRPDELDDDKSGSSAGTAGTNLVIRWDPVASLGSQEPAALETGTLNGSSQNLVSAKHSLTEHEAKNFANEHPMNRPVLDPVGGVVPNPAVVQDEQNLTSVDRGNESSGVLAGANFQVLVEPRNLFSSCSEYPKSARKLPKDEPFSCTEVDAVTQDNTSEQKPSSSLNGEVEKVNTSLMLLNGRRDLLGRDDMGRVYWALCGAKTVPWLAVETVSSTNQSEGKDGQCLGSSAQFPSVDNREGNNLSRKRDLSSKPDESSNGSPTDIYRIEADEVQGQQRRRSSWHIYSSEFVVDQLIGWLSLSSNKERMLKSTLLQWKSLLFFTKGEQHAGDLRRGLLASPRSRGYGSTITDSQTSLPEDVQKSRIKFMPALKASSLLEWKCGQFGDPIVKQSAVSGGSKKGRKRKAQQPSELTRCDCLEPVWASRCHCMVCHTTCETEGEFQAHKTGGGCSKAGGKAFDRYGDMRSGKRPSLTSKSPTSAADSQKPASTRQLPAGTDPLPDVSKIPMVVLESLQDRVNRIGYGPDKGPLFAPGLAISPAFDPALMMVDPSPVNGGSEADAKGILGTLAVGATSNINQVGEKLLNGHIPEVTSRGENTVAFSFADHAGCQTSMLGARDGPLPKDGVELTSKEEPNSVQSQPAASAPGHESAPPGAGDLPNGPNETTSGHEGHGKTFRVTGKELTIPESSLRPLESDEDLNMLQQLKAKLLDIEAAVTQEMSEKARAYPRRRQAWRSMVKMAMSIYKVVQAVILLEQMICADFLRTSWCYWSSLTVAAKTATLSSLFLRVYALDSAILYEKSESYAGADLTNRQPRPEAFSLFNVVNACTPYLSL
ncbi:hypothetical protein R1flu_027602 [Riccia fluitans]|uniref:Uncharacterized protein n=1 Tax=Riccia fluitans TaxID=41844 RepID=A0ABD1XJT2_9MARC